MNRSSAPVQPQDNQVFRALADPSRRQLLDRLYARNGQTLAELSRGLAMARQSVSQHLALLHEARLLSVQWYGREKRHFIEPGPISDVYLRWMGKFAVTNNDDLIDNQPSVAARAPSSST